MQHNFSVSKTILELYLILDVNGCSGFWGLIYLFIYLVWGLNFKFNFSVSQCITARGLFINYVTQIWPFFAPSPNPSPWHFITKRPTPLINYITHVQHTPQLRLIYRRFSFRSHLVYSWLIPNNNKREDWWL